MDVHRFFVWIVFPLVFWAAMISSFLPPNTQVLMVLASCLREWRLDGNRSLFPPNLFAE
jgi:hypothetical protein